MDLSRGDVRQLALAAQGFGRRPAKPTLADVRKLATRLLAIHIDSINVVVRSQYLVPYSRLGAYPTEALDKLTYSRRELFESLAHSTALLPVDLLPLLRHRMERRAARGAWTPKGVRLDPEYIEEVYAEVEATGPLTASELSNTGGGDGKWWGWSIGKTAVEHLWGCGRLAVAGREDFTRVYDVTERVLPKKALDAPTPDAETAQKQLLLLSAGSLGVGTARQVADFFGLTRNWELPRGPDGKRPKPTWPRLVRELVDDGELTAVTVEGWTEPGYMRAGTRVPRSIDVRALVSPFDELLSGAELRFGFVQNLAKQLYLPAERREYGYYVLPFVLGDEIVARCDLKSDRKSSRLLVQASYLEFGHDRGEVAAELAVELHEMAGWLGLDEVRVADRGDLAKPLLRAVPRSRR